MLCSSSFTLNVYVKIITKIVNQKAIFLREDTTLVGKLQFFSVLFMFFFSGFTVSAIQNHGKFYWYRVMRIRICLSFAFLRSPIGFRNSRHSAIQSESEVKPIVTHSHTFSRASRQRPPCLQSLCDTLGVVGCAGVGSSLKMVTFEPTTPNMLQHGDQTHTTCCAQQCCDMLR